jgi:PTH1 family peptidyl-tRNA hydrolase
MLAKPQTFMNLSGVAVKPLLEKNCITAKDLILVYDELDLPWATLRVRPQGSAGGHHGVESVIRSLGTSEFARVRLGVHPGHEVRDGAEFVLSSIKRGQMKELDELVANGATAVSSIISEGVEKSMARFNRRARGSTTEEE